MTLLTNLSDPYWRLNNLYFILDKYGRKVPFRFNKFQDFLYKNLHTLNIILKARQLGMTTFIALYFLDRCLFEPTKQAAIIAHIKGDAQKIFETKIKFAWDNLPEEIRERIGVNTESARELKFGLSGSSIRVTTSVRSGSINMLHISELGILAQRYPQKANEIVTGSLNAIARGQTVFIESTAKGQDGPFYEMCMQAMRFQKEGRPLTEMDYKFFFFPWWENEEYRLDTPVVVPIELQKYFDKLQVSGLESFVSLPPSEEHRGAGRPPSVQVVKPQGIVLSNAQKYWYVKMKEVQKDDMFSEYPSTPEEAFAASVEGAYYGGPMDRARADHRIRRVPWEPAVFVHTFWDLGMDDTNAIVFVQQVGHEIHFIDYYEASGEGMVHYAKMLREKPYVYGTHYLPHDAEVRELGTGKSRAEVARQLGISPLVVVRNMPIIDGIEAVRDMLPRTWFDEERCDKIIKALTNYRKDWDDNLGRWKDSPRHDQWSHAADAVRTGALGLIFPTDTFRTDRLVDTEQKEQYDKHSVIGSVF